MNRSKKLIILSAVLLAACLVTVFALNREQKKEEIKVSGETVLNIPADEVTSLSWDQPDGTVLKFTKDGEWKYDEDEFFPVDGQKLEEILLSPFENFSAAFIIENVEDYAQYGLDKPLCTIHIGTEDESYEIKLGNYSSMDSQRYVSFGDGNVYLAVSDPMDAYDIEFKNLIKNDIIPSFDDFTSISIEGEEKLYFIRDENLHNSYRSGDIYYANRSGEMLPLDNHNVEEFADKIQYLSLNNYASYNTAPDELKLYGMDNPELKVKISYTEKDEDGNEHPEEFTLSISRDPEELEKKRSSEENYSTDTMLLEDGQDITAYARVNDSDIIYKINGEDYQRLMVCRYNDLRNHHILPMDFEDIVQLDFRLDGETYSFIKSGDKYTYMDEEIDMDEIESSLVSLMADSFTDEAPKLKEEISIKAYMDEELSEKAEISIYRYDGDSCLAVVNGRSFALTERQSVVSLIENLHSIVLNSVSPAEAAEE